MEAGVKEFRHIIRKIGRRQDGKGIFQLCQPHDNFVTTWRIALSARDANCDRM